LVVVVVAAVAVVGVLSTRLSGRAGCGSHGRSGDACLARDDDAHLNRAKGRGGCKRELGSGIGDEVEGNSRV